jgi:fructose-specific component phosphotransferase system IIB-like protein
VAARLTCMLAKFLLTAALGLAVPSLVRASPAADTIRSVGSVTRHASKFVGQHVVLRGYLLAHKPGYILFSDEALGTIGRYDLPVTGPGAEAMQAMRRYVLEGTFLDSGLAADNGNPDHLALSLPPREAQP